MVYNSLGAQAERADEEIQPMQREFNVIIERDAEGYYVATVPELRGCHTQAKSLDTLMKRAARGDRLMPGSPGRRSSLVEVCRRSENCGPLMTKLPRLSARQLIGALRKAGFQVIRRRGSHRFLQHADGRATVVPVHATERIGPGLLFKILRDCEITRDELLRLL